MPGPIRRVMNQHPREISLHAGHAHAHGRLLRGRGPSRARRPERRRRVGRPALREALQPVARRLQGRHDRLQGFSARLSQVAGALRSGGYARVPSMPGSRLDLEPSTSFEDYLRPSSATRRARIFAANIARPPRARRRRCRSSPTSRRYIDELFPLYRQVLQKSHYKFEELTEVLLPQARPPMNDRDRLLHLAPERQGRRVQLLRGARGRAARPLHRPRLRGRARVSISISSPGATSSPGRSRTAATATTARR